MTDEDNTTRDTRAPRRQFDPIMLILGVATLAVAAYIIGYGYVPFPHLDTKWVIAGGGVLVGVLMLTASLRPKRNR
jgi:hypothetical protein